MTKKWIGFFLSLIILIFIAYFAMGFMVKNTLSKTINKIPKNSIMSIQLDKYRRGWFSSQALWTFKIHIPAQTITDKNGVPKTEPPLDFEMAMPITIKHGPIIFTNYGIRFGVGAITTQPETHYGVFINYLNHLIIKYSLPSVKMHGKETSNNEEFQFNWLGLSALFSLSSNIDNIRSDLNLYGIEGSADNVNVKIGQITHAFNSKRIQDWLWVGESYFNISSVLVNATSQDIFALEGFDLMLGSEVTNGLLNFNCKLLLQKLLANNQNYGPAIVALNLKNLDAATMAELNKQEFSMLQNADPNLVMISLATELPKLLNKGPVLELNEMNINLPEGKIIGNFKIYLPKTEISDLSKAMQLAKGQGYFKAPMAVVKELMVAAIKSDLNNQKTGPAPNNTTSPQSLNVTNLDEEAENQANKMLQNLVTQGFLKIEDKDYVLQFKLENQQFIVNGKLFTPDMLQ